MKIISVLFIIFLFSIYAIGQEASPEIKRITLKDGSELIGQIVEEDADKIRFKTSGGVEMEINRDLIEKIEDLEPKVEAVSEISKGKYQVGDHELLIMPTAYTMEDGQAYFSNYELFILNFSYAPTSSTHISVLMLFPIVSEFVETISFGVKQKYLNSENVKGALGATYTPKPSLVTIGTVFSIGSGPDGFHAGISMANSLEREDENKDKWEWIYMFGYRVDVSQKISLVAEYTNFSAAVEENFNGLLSLGVRFRGVNNTWDLAGIRPLESTGDFIFFPLLKATFLF